MKQEIIGFHLDEKKHWVARLKCGHKQHVRHQPPWVNRPWTQSEKTREEMLGQPLNCRKCDRGEAKD